MPDPIPIPKKRRKDSKGIAVLEVLVNCEWVEYKRIMKTPEERWDGVTLAQVRPLTRIRFEEAIHA